MRALVDEVVEQGKTDPFCLKIREGEATGFSTPLDVGTVVLSPIFLDGAGREDEIQWVVRDPDALPKHKPFGGTLPSLQRLNALLRANAKVFWSTDLVTTSAGAVSFIRDTARRAARRAAQRSRHLHPSPAHASAAG